MLKSIYTEATGLFVPFSGNTLDLGTHIYYFLPKYQLKAIPLKRFK